jgi:hypothetical protein
VTPLAAIAPSFQGRKPIASYQRGRAVRDSDRALCLIFSKRRRAGFEIRPANPTGSARPKPYEIRAARSADGTARPARIATVSVDDFARIGPKATSTPAQECGRDRRREATRRRVPVTKIRGRSPARALPRRGHEGGGEVGLSIAEGVGELANKRRGFPMAVEPPTIASLQSQGVPGFFVTCSNPMCLHSTPIAFETLSLDPSTPLPEIEKGRSFICPACGSRQISTLPHWSGRPDADR